MKCVKMRNNWWSIGNEDNLEKTVLHNVESAWLNNVNVSDCDIVEVENWQDLNWQNTVYLDDKYKTGWLSPSGKFYGCEFENHELQAELVHKKDEEILEKEGYIKLTYLMEDTKEIWALFCADSYNHNAVPTKEQLKYLASLEDCNLTQMNSFLDDTLEL